MNWSIQRVAVAYALFFLGGCGAVSPYKVESVDYADPQSKAAILLSDPQVYARASLINDRRHETEYLQQLLDNSQPKPDGTSVVKFSPQIIRDLKTVDALSASLGLSVGKTLNTSATDLSDQIQVAKLQAQLATLQKQIEGIQAAQPPTVTIPAPTLATDVSGATTTGSAQILTPDASKLQSQISSIQTQLATLASSAAAGPTAPANAYSALLDPRDDFMDRQAYRRDIRAALAEAQLDDTHNRNGNALYRLQFQATVLPPSGTNRQWGLAQIRVGPPALNEDEVVSDYYNWLGHITSVLNESFPDSKHNYDYDRDVAQIGALGFFDIMDVLAAKDGSNRHYCMDHEQATDDQLGQLARPGNTQQHPVVQGSDNKDYVFLGTYAVPPGLLPAGKTCAPYDSVINPNSVAKPESVTKSNFVAKSKYPVSNANEIPANIASFITSQIRRYERPTTIGNLRGTIGPVYHDDGTEAATGQGARDRRTYFPTLFCRKLTVQVTVLPKDLPGGKCGDGPTGIGTGLFLAAGGTTRDLEHDYAVRSYSVLPVELAQRLGVTTEASQSLETALTVAAQLSAATSGSLGIGYLSQSDTRAEALARQPMVVGFAGADIFDGQTPSESYFGWLLGPQFALKDSRTMSLQQTVRSYGVNADVAVPGWWSYVELVTDTAWVHDWQNADLLENPGTVREVRKRVNLPQVDASFDALTEFLANATFTAQNTRIFASTVTPDVIPACASTVTFQINGTNMWRVNSALLGGVPAKLITVLPDMNGITAQFDMADVFGGLVNANSTVQTLPLLVSAEEGSATPLPVYVVGERHGSNGLTNCQSPLLAPTSTQALKSLVVSYAPTSVCTDTEAFELAVQGLKLKDGYRVAGGLFQSPAGGPGSIGDENTQVLELKRNWSALGSAGPGSTAKPSLTARIVDLILTKDGEPPLQASLDVKECKTTQTPQTKVKPASPAGVTVTSTGGALNVTFSASKDDGNGAVTQYKATATNDNAAKKEKPLTAPSSGLSLSITLPKCTVGDSYSVSVVASRNGVDSDPDKAAKSTPCNK